MTKKENLYINILNVRNDYYQVSGKADQMINVSEYENTYAFRSYIDKHKVFELEKELKIAEQALKDAIKKNEKEKWFATEEGRAFREQNEAARKQLHEQILMLREDGFEHTRKVVKTLLGSDWDVISFGGRNMKIGIVESYRENGTAKGLFGHEFNVYFDKKLNFKDDTVSYEWELNYGTMGSFSIGEDENRTKYLVGLAKFASDTAVIPALREYLHGLVKSIDLLQKQGYKLEEEFNNPPALAA